MSLQRNKVHHVYTAGLVAKRLGVVTDDQVRSYERANKELEDLRDGKFPNIPRLDSAGKVLSGSRPKVI